jgi:hypothetical protein
VRREALGRGDFKAGLGPEAFVASVMKGLEGGW